MSPLLIFVAAGTAAFLILAMALARSSRTLAAVVDRLEKELSEQELLTAQYRRKAQRYAERLTTKENR